MRAAITHQDTRSSALEGLSVEMAVRASIGVSFGVPGRPSAGVADGISNAAANGSSVGWFVSGPRPTINEAIKSKANPDIQSLVFINWLSDPNHTFASPTNEYYRPNH